MIFQYMNGLFIPCVLWGYAGLCNLSLCIPAVMQQRNTYLVPRGVHSQTKNSLS